MKNLVFNKKGLVRIALTLLLVLTSYISPAQHIQYRDKRKPVIKESPTPENIPPRENNPIPPPEITMKIMPVDTLYKPVVLKKDTSKIISISRVIFIKNSRPRKPYIEEQNMCNLLSDPAVAPQLPLIINKVSPEMVKMLKERYAGHLYSITGLNMMDERLKFKLKICDKNNGKFRSEYLDKDGNVIDDPNLGYE
ncbi:MAG: hypothetical protein ACR2KX_03910 [Chitinophagaceae bacterium]